MVSEATSGETALFHCKIALSRVDLTSLKVTLLLHTNWLHTETVQKWAMLKDIKARGGEKAAAWAEGRKAAGQGAMQRGWELG